MSKRTADPTYRKNRAIILQGNPNCALCGGGGVAALAQSLANSQAQAAQQASVSIAQQEKNTGGGSTYEARFIIGGQIAGFKPKTYLIYPQGNHITTSDDTPYLQIGESKYGKPILDRIIDSESTLETAVVCGLVSMDSTIKSNLTVGPPIEVIVYETDALNITRQYRFDESG